MVAVRPLCVPLYGLIRHDSGRLGINLVIASNDTDADEFLIHYLAHCYYLVEFGSPPAPIRSDCLIWPPFERQINNFISQLYNFF